MEVRGEGGREEGETGQAERNLFGSVFSQTDILKLKTKSWRWDDGEIIRQRRQRINRLEGKKKILENVHT